jgi:hypothetical protein
MMSEKEWLRDFRWSMLADLDLDNPQLCNSVNEVIEHISDRLMEIDEDASRSRQDTQGVTVKEWLGELGIQ